MPTACPLSMVNGPGQHQDVSPLIRGRTGCDECAAGPPGLDNEGGFAEARQRSVAAMKMMLPRWCAQGKLADQHPFRHHPFGQPLVARRVNPVHPRWQYRNGTAPSGQRCIMRDAVNAQRQPADHNQPRRCSGGSELSGGTTALKRWLSCPDNRQRGRTEIRQNAPTKQKRRPIGTLPQKWRVLRVLGSD